MRIVGYSLSKWRVTRVQNEKDYTKSKKINNLSLIRLSAQDLRSHIALSSQNSVKETTAISSFDRCCKTEISNLSIIIAVKKNVLWFQVTVDHSLTVAVMKRLQHLFEVKTANFSSEGPKRYVIKQLTSLNKLHHDVSDSFLPTILLYFECISLELNALYSVRMPDFHQGFNFFRQIFNHLFIISRVLFREHLDRNKFAIRTLSLSLIHI